ncbi:DUF4388 domain-containing protein [Tepidiforma sp.]|uniref:DUF4388 domain-containing protein n=1 Tax=Tepidiforma sp. TaxID=2682230 RepID=UPI002ADE82C3|nr:DUF4388 domain-containing protein [Tepidiforma sp.]
MPEGLTGSLAQLPLIDLLKMLAAGGQTGRLELSSGLDLGDLYLHQGHVVHAEAAGEWGEPAFARLITWPNGQFRFIPGEPAPERTITRPLDQLLAEAARLASEREAVRRVVPSMDVVPRLPRKAPAPTITIDAADWETIAVIDGTRTAAAIAAALGLDDYDTMRRLYRLKLSGLVELEKAPQVAPSARALAGPQFFQALHAAVAAAVGPLAEIIIDDCLDAMGYTRQDFPRDGVAALAEAVSNEITDAEKRVRFQQTMLAMLRGNRAA